MYKKVFEEEKSLTKLQLPLEQTYKAYSTLLPKLQVYLLAFKLRDIILSKDISLLVKR
ncbi:hypothetical protein PMY56_16550 [Clostridium tertium]|uniref:hypothetical protein n=1 Tax=Clostridium TaxID=1485 RepID=UPI00232BFD19|nr:MULTISPECIES: hypothetical protein [Clostridium]MDB1921597.1 hypothetical protein [Clostridium tertium]MDB1927744.1 hypothetical protein [Clostridium tertium]MDB1931551.1 hypothetical protein [Clostridium tertium]